MSVSRDAMYAAFESQPGDLTGYMAMSDELLELGYANLAHAFNWMSKRGRWPHFRANYAIGAVKGRKVPKKFGWAWYGELNPDRPSLWHPNDVVPGIWPRVPILPHSLPRLAMIGDQRLFQSHQMAVMWLAKQLESLRETWVAELPKPASTFLDVSSSGDPLAMREAPEFAPDIDTDESTANAPLHRAWPVTNGEPA